MRYHSPGFGKIWLLLAVCAVLLAIAGCATVPSPTATTTTPTTTSSATPTTSSTPTPSASATPTVSPSPSASPTPSSTVVLPQVFILTPLFNVTVPPGDVTVNIKVTNFNIVDKLGQANVAGEGHVIYYLDAAPPTTAGQVATTAAGTFAESVSTTYTWKNVTAGDHKIAVQLVNNDGTPLTPAIYASVPLPVVAPTPTPSPSASPTPSASATP